VLGLWPLRSFLASLSRVISKETPLPASDELSPCRWGELWSSDDFFRLTTVFFSLCFLFRVFELFLFLFFGCFESIALNLRIDSGTVMKRELERCVSEATSLRVLRKFLNLSILPDMLVLITSSFELII